MSGHSIKFEILRIFSVRWNIVSLMVLMMLLLVSLYPGISHIDTQSGQPDFMTVLCGSDGGYFHGPAGLLFLLGSLFMIAMGMTAYIKEHAFFRFGNILIRLVVLNMMFFILWAVLYWVSALAGIHPNGGENDSYVHVSLYLFLFLSFFYAAGVFLRTWYGRAAKAQSRVLVSVFSFWLVSIIILPEIISLFPQATESVVALVYPTLFYRFITVVRTPTASLVIPVVITLFYILAFLLAAYLRLKGSRNLKPGVVIPSYPFQQGASYFVLCKDREYKENYLNWFRARQEVICIDNLEAEEIDAGVSLPNLIAYFCNVAKVNPVNVNKRLELLGRTLEHRSSEDIQAIYFAVLLELKGDTVVLDDILKGKSRGLELRFLHLLSLLNQSGKTVVCLGMDIYQTALPFDGPIRNSNYKSFRIDPQVVSLR